MSKPTAAERAIKLALQATSDATRQRLGTEAALRAKAANDAARGPRTSHGDLVRIRQEIAAAAFAQTPRGKRLLAARR